ncbi:MAG: lamin tail domain-containing protein, partial [Myxococcaceae bacterium]|nr:lamin tail domain-containing protein [Myxococcaceae bacterium]
TCSTAGACGVNFTPNGTAVTSQTAGDCQQNQCDGAGAIVSVAQNSDVPVDGNQCTDDVCSNGVPMNPAVVAGAACTQNGGSYCNGTGVCVECTVATQCPGSDTECRTRTCSTAGVCGATFTPTGTVISAQTAGDCQQAQCDGAGAIVSVALNSDLPVDGSQCTDDVCTSGVPSNPPLSAGTTCNQNGGTACDGAGVCVGPPTVVSTTPADGATVPASTTVAVTFSTAMTPASLTGQTTAGACSGSIQVSLDNFASCIAFSAASAAMSVGNTVATLTPAPGLLVNTTYKLRVTTAATGAGGAAMASAFSQSTGFTTSSPNLCEGTVVISQLFGGGGTSATVPNADFVELHNRGSTPVSVTGWSIQYASAAGTSWTSIALTGSIPADGYFLVRTQAAQGTGTALPTPDVPGTAINLAQAAGKLALVNNTTALTGDCPTATSIVDFVGFGTTATCREGGTTTAANAPAPSASTSISRVGSTCADVNLNASDFASGTPTPRNSASSPQACACVVRNESGAALEPDFCNVQFPASLAATTGTTVSTTFGRVYEAGVTEAAGASSTVRAQLGYGAATANPQYQSWTWTNATYNLQVGNDDEYQGAFTAPAVGTYRYAYRFSLDQGVSWTVCDPNGSGANAGLTFELGNVPVLTVTP